MENRKIALLSNVNMTFLVMDLAEVLEHRIEIAKARKLVKRWFADLEMTLKEKTIYYISDAYLWCSEVEICHDLWRKQELEQIMFRQPKTGRWRNCILNGVMSR